MTVANERLIDYLGLELELCYWKTTGGTVWILADKIRRKDDIALEMLRIFHRLTRIGKSIARIDESGPETATPITSNNTPYAACIGVRVRVKDHVAGMHLRVGIDPELVVNAPSLSSGMLLDPNFELQVDDPIVQILASPKARPPLKALPDKRTATSKPKRLKASEKA